MSTMIRANVISAGSDADDSMDEIINYKIIKGVQN
jgi:hypothetical protein